MSADSSFDAAHEVDAEVTHARGVILAANQREIEASLARDDGTLRELSEAAVVVVGEVKRGKSSIINALVGKPDLCPVDADVATNTYLVVRNGTPRALAHLDGAQEPLEIEPADIARYATTTGNPDNALGVQRVEVWTPAPVLEGLSIVDTPGVGGLESAHRRLVLDALEVASALVFVLDATATISRPELDFLGDASERVDTIVVVVAKIDAVPEWHRVVLDDRAVLASVGPRFERCPVLGVSSKLVFSAQEFEGQGYHDHAVALRAESGIDDLVGMLRMIAAQTSPAVLATRLRRTRTALDTAKSGVSELIVAEQATPAFAEQISEAEDRLEALRQDSESWRQQLTTRVADLQIDAIARLQTARVEAARNVDQAIARGGTSAATEELVQTEVEVLNRQTMDDLASRILGIGRDILGALLETTSLPAVATEIANHQPTRQVTQNQRPGRRASPLELAVEDATTAFQGDNIAHAIAEGLRLVAANAIAFAGPGALIGLGWAAGLHFIKRKGAKTEEARRWAANALIEAQEAIRLDIQRSLVKAQDQLTTAVRGAIDTRARDLREARAALDRARAGDDKTRAATVKKLGRQRKELATAIDRVDALLAAVSGGLELTAAQP